MERKFSCASTQASVAKPQATNGEPVATNMNEGASPSLSLRLDANGGAEISVTENTLSYNSKREDGFHGSLGAKKRSKEELERKRKITDKIRSFRSYSPEDEKEERRLGVSTKLKLFEDPWTIKKILTKSDVNDLCRLMLPTRTVENHIMALFGTDRKAKVYYEDGAMVTVWDYDTGSAHELAFKRWQTSKSFVFTNNWMTKFVKRRSLKEGDEIGIFWDSSSSRFGFRVLARAPPHVDE